MLEFLPENLPMVARCSNKDYHAMEGYLSSSFLKAVLGGGASYMRWQSKQFVETPSMKFGTLVHGKLLEPATFSKEFAFLPPELGKLNSKKAIAHMEGDDRIWHSQKDLDKLQNILEYFPPNVMDWLNSGENELSLFVQLLDGLGKARFDCIHEDAGIIFDVKTTSSPDWFWKDVKDYGYDLQAFFYKMVAEEYYGKDFRFIWIVVSTVAPFHTQWFEASEKTLNRGFENFENALEMLKNFTDNGIDLNLSDTIELL